MKECKYFLLSKDYSRCGSCEGRSGDKLLSTELVGGEGDGDEGEGDRLR